MDKYKCLICKHLSKVLKCLIKYPHVSNCVWKGYSYKGLVDNICLNP